MEDHRTTQATSHALGRGSTLALQRCHLLSLQPCSDRGGLLVGGLSLISRSKVNRGCWTMLIEDWRIFDQLGRLTKRKRARSVFINMFSLMAAGLGIFQQQIPPKTLENIWSNFRLSIGTGQIIRWKSLLTGKINKESLPVLVIEQ